MDAEEKIRLQVASKNKNIIDQHRTERSWFFNLQNADDVDYSISKALSSVELERDNDGQQRK